MNPLEELERIHKEATQGPWEIDPHSSTHVVGAGRRHVSSTGGYSTNTDNGEHHHENDSNARLSALSRNIVGPVIELARAAEAVIADVDTVVETYSTRPQVESVFDPLRAALDALLRAIESEVSR